MNPLPLLIVAGEASGDAHAASLVRALRDAAPETQFEFFGSTGIQMREAGVDSIVKADELALLGLWEVGRALPKFWRAFGELKRAAENRKPAAAILVDWPDFNLRLARWLHRRRIPVIYYISPQLWAWRSYRARTIQRDVDLLLSILPFEKDWYAARGISNVEYVGHPLAGAVHARFDRAEFCRQNNLDPSRPILAFCPEAVTRSWFAFCRQCLRRFHRFNSSAKIRSSLSWSRRIATPMRQSRSSLCMRARRGQAIPCESFIIKHVKHWLPVTRRQSQVALLRWKPRSWERPW